MSIRQGVRIGLCGAGGTGKTTTMNFLEKELELPSFKSASRIVYEAKDLTEEIVQTQFSNEEKLALQTEIFDVKVFHDQKYTYVTDRTVLDHYCYCLAYCGGFMENDTFAEFEERVRTLMLSTYTHIFYFPWGYFEASSDGVRQDRQSWQSQIDAIMLGYLVRWNIPAIEVPQTQGIDYRNEWIMEKLAASLGSEK